MMLEGTVADSAAVAGFRSLMSATPGARIYCLAIGNPAFYRDPTSGEPSSRDPSQATLHMLQATAGAPTVFPSSACTPGRSAGTAMLTITHMLPLGDGSVAVSASTLFGSGGTLYTCRVRRERSRWEPGPCQLTAVG